MAKANPAAADSAASTAGKGGARTAAKSGGSKAAPAGSSASSRAGARANARTSAANVRKTRGKAGTSRRGDGHEGTRGNAPDDPGFVQLLTPEGERVEHPDYSADFTDEEYRGLYRDLVIVRRLDAEATALQRQGELGIWASLLGQEAAQIGSGRALSRQDMAFPTYREHGVLWCRGIDPIMPLGLFRGVDFGGWDSRETKLQMYTIVIGAQTLHATGYAMGIAKDGKCGGEDDSVNEAVIAYFGDGATSEGDVNESFVWASVFNAPMVFFCQNNQYAISEPVERQARAPIYRRAYGYGFPGVRVDGNDVLASYAVTKVALDSARRGEGPSMIEAYTYRMGAHTTSDDPTRYRIASEVEEWRQRDPVLRMRTFLEKQKLADSDYFAGIDDEADRHAADLRARVLALPDPDPASMFDSVYPHGSEPLAVQREQFVNYHAGFESPAEDGFGNGSESGGPASGEGRAR